MLPLRQKVQLPLLKSLMASSNPPARAHLEHDLYPTTQSHQSFNDAYLTTDLLEESLSLAE